MVLLLLIGFLSVLAQVVMLRELSVAFYGIELVYLLAIGMWLLGTGIGVTLFRREWIPSRRAIHRLLLIFSLILPLAIAFVRGSRILFGGVSGAYLPFERQMAALVVALLPVSGLLGLLFQWAAKRFIAQGKTIAIAYAIESAGAVMGGLVSTVSLHVGLPNLATGLIAAAIVPVVVRFEAKKEEGRRVMRAGALVLIVVLVTLVALTPTLNLGSTRWNHPHAVATRDTPYSRVTVTKHQGLVSVYDNDVLSFETEGTSAELFAHLVGLQHPAPATILILGSGFDGTIREIMKHRPARIDVLDLNRAALTTALPWLPDDVRRSLSSPITKMYFGDPRAAVKSLGKYDVILLGMPDPTSAQANRFYTRDFFRLVREHLTEPGVFGLRLRSAENYWTPDLAQRNASIIGALEMVFADVMVLPGVTNVVMASEDSLLRDPSVLAARLEQRRIEARLVDANFLHYLYTNDRFNTIPGWLDRAEAPINRDDHPICFLYATSIWLSKFYPQLFRIGSTRAFFDENGETLAVAALGIPLILLLMRRWRTARLSLLVGVAGACGMLLETLLILQYQVKQGVLYQDIGLLLTLFMAGLTVGALAAARALEGLKRRFSARARATAWTALGALLVVLNVALCYGTAWSIAHGGLQSVVAIGGLLGASGFFVSGTFVYASTVSGAPAPRVLSLLYAADVIGGALGTLLGGLLLIPLLGLVLTAIAAGLLGCCALLLL